MLPKEYLIGVRDLLEDDECELCGKTRPRVYLCTLDDGSEVQVCRTHHDQLTFLRKRARDRREQADDIQLNPVAFGDNGRDIG